MKQVTDPNILAQLDSPESSGLKPVTDQAILAQLEGGEGNSMDSSQKPLYQRLIPDIAAGLATAGQGIHNFLLPFAKTNIDFGKEFGVNNPTLVDNLVQGGAQYAPYGAGEGALIAGKGLGALGRLGADMAAGGAFGGTQSEDPASGAALGAGAGAIGHGLGKLAGSIAGIPGAIKNYLSTNDLVKNAPEFLNNLASGVTDRANMPLSLKDQVASLYKRNQGLADTYAHPLNNADVRFDVQDGKASFPSYAEAASDLLAQRDNLKNLFGSDSAIGAKINREINAAESFLNNKDAYGVDFQDIWGRLKDLGKLQAQASKSGNRNEARILGNLRSSLSEDLQNNLRDNGHAPLANYLTRFNNFYKNKVVPFWDNTTISKAAQVPRNVPQSPALAKALYGPSIGSKLVFDQLSPEIKNALLHQLVTGGKGTSEGLSNMSAEDIGRAYGNLTSQVKSNIASHNPAADAYFERLSNLFSKAQQGGLISKAMEKLTGMPMGNAISYLPKNQISPSLQNILGFGLTPAISNAADSYLIKGGR